MDRFDIERIAQTIIRDYGLPVRVATLSFERAGRCIVQVSERCSPGTTVAVGVWCDAKASPHYVRESLKQGLHVSD